MIFGIDRGTTYTKTDNLRKFKSTVRKIDNDDVLINNNCLIVEYESSKYVIGEKGNFETDLLKSENKDTVLLILTAIAQCTNDTYITSKIVTGLPIGLYSNQKQKLKQLLDDTSENIIINGTRKVINIHRAEIFPEGAGAFFSTDNQNGLVIDVGGLSVDVALFEDKKLVKYSTYPMGVMKLYSRLVNRFNSQYDLSLTEWDIERVLKEGLYIYGEKKDIDKTIYDIGKDHTQGIINRLNLEYDLKNRKNIILAGGGINLHKHLKEQFKHAETIHNTQFANAIGYKAIGRSLYA